MLSAFVSAALHASSTGFTLSGAVPQTVPSSSNLYKNSFTYHTVDEVPPDFEACNRFLGAPQSVPAPLTKV